MKRGGLSVFHASLAFLSTIVGGGIVSLPYAFFHASISVSIIMSIVFAVLTLYSCYLYLQAKDLTGNLKYVLS